MSDWRLLDTGVLTGAENMALDDAILECRAEMQTANTLRFLQFKPSTVLVGYHQSVEQEVRLPFTTDNGVEINRRITGGGTILFTPTCLGWEIFAGKTAQGVNELRTDLGKLAEFISNGAIRGLKKLGVDAEFRPKNDIEVNGRKITGTGGTERGDSFMYQGTLLIDFDIDLMLRSLRIPVEKLKDKEIDSVKERVTCLKWELGYVPPLEEIKKAFKEGFEEILGSDLTPGGLLPVEQSMFEERLPYFKSNEWIDMVRRPENTAGNVSAMKKTPGGLIRVSVALDVPGKYIISSFIAGDFQVFPQRAIMDLEARLKDTPTDSDSIRRIVHDFFTETGTRVFGIEPNDFVELILEAVKKTAFLDYGVSLEDSNQLMTVNFMPDDLDKQTFDYILLPYCAKLVDCEYRWVEGCSMCGDCSTSEVYEQVQNLGVPVRTIQSFEHLMTTIQEFKEKGARGYIGSCCEAFKGKHHDDFVKTGVPMLLVDLDDSTCYDLGKEHDAYAGEFEGQTVLKKDLFMHIIQTMWDRKNLKAEIDVE
ncbi:MAG: lipoate--protein ligase family protein [Candidatus Thorarchaeota archaeon]|nr:MAG: lipoate--protein ligase family protein [Candidatus Thorarchaeota archaeon]